MEKHQTVSDNRSIRIYVNKIEKRIKLLLLKTMKLLGSTIIIHLIVRLIKKTLLYKKKYFLESAHSESKIKVELSNYAPKSNLRNAAGLDTSDSAKKLIWLA